MSGGHLDTVRPDEDAEAVVDRMERDQVRRVPVVSEDGRLEGIIAQADVAKKLGPQSPLKIEELLERLSEPHRADVAP